MRARRGSESMRHLGYQEGVKHQCQDVETRVQCNAGERSCSLLTRRMEREEEGVPYSSGSAIVGDACGCKGRRRFRINLQIQMEMRFETTGRYFRCTFFPPHINENRTRDGLKNSIFAIAFVSKENRANQPK